MKLLVFSSVLVACLATLPSPSVARPTFVQLIPSGSAVQGIRALGHQNSSGGGTLNAFGQAFKANNFQWTTTLCQVDSDGDGATNGQELGDPCCSWQPGSATSTQAPITHPGVANTFSAADITAMRCLRTGGAAASGTETQPGGPISPPIATEPATGTEPVTNNDLSPPVAAAGSGSTSAEPSASPLQPVPTPTTKESNSASDKPSAPASAACPAAVVVGFCVTVVVTTAVFWS